jgi:hypothetical protein
LLKSPTPIFSIAFLFSSGKGGWKEREGGASGAHRTETGTVMMTKRARRGGMEGGREGKVAEEEEEVE